MADEFVNGTVASIALVQECLYAMQYGLMSLGKAVSIWRLGG